MSPPLRLILLVSLVVPTLSACNRSPAPASRAAHKVTVTRPDTRPVTITEQYTGQIRAYRHIQVRSLKTGYLEEILITAGQLVQTGDVLFRLRPKVLQEDPPPPEDELRQVSLRAAFDGEVAHLRHPQGSLIHAGETLATLADNSTVWVYFNVPEARYLEYMQQLKEPRDDLRFELQLPTGQKYPAPGTFGAIQADFNHQTGTIAFRADFPNPDRVLRHGQFTNLLIQRVVPDALVIPQRTTFEILDKRYVYVVGADHVARQREVSIQNELDDMFVIQGGVDTRDRIVLDGIREIRDGDLVDYEERPPERIVAGRQFPAE